MSNPVAAPIGSLAAWLKSFTNVPSLPEGWVECNGQTLSDTESMFNGQVIPNLNGGNRFLRGNSTSGGTGGSESVILTTEQIPSHRHNFSISGKGTGQSSYGVDSVSWGDDGVENVFVTYDAGGGQSHENCPPFYDVVWIMRVK